MNELLLVDAFKRLLDGQINESMIVGFMSGAVAFFVFGLVVYAFFIWVIKSIAKFIILKKAGDKGWKAFIPYYGDYTMYKLTWNTKMFWVALALNVATYFIPVDATGFLSILSLALSICIIVVYAKRSYNIARAFGHGVGFAIGYLFLGSIFRVILALDNSVYRGNTTLNKEEK